MDDKVFDDIEIAPPSVVLSAARDFAAALAETPQFQALEAATECLNHDPAARQILQALEAKQQALEPLLLLNSVSVEERAELEQLRLAFVNQPSVAAYFQAQADLKAICQAAADWLSEAIGLNYAAACGSGCC